jgi:hypothetical protein
MTLLQAGWRPSGITHLMSWWLTLIRKTDVGRSSNFAVSQGFEEGDQAWQRLVHLEIDR